MNAAPETTAAPKTRSTIASRLMALLQHPKLVTLKTEVDLGARLIGLVLRPFAVRMRELQSECFAMDEIWNILEDEGAGEHGLRYGDSVLLDSLAPRRPVVELAEDDG